MKSAIATVCLAILTVVQPVYGQAGDAPKYSQKVLLKNWALSRCLGQVYSNGQAAEDANATASAYLEFGRQPIEVYEALNVIVDKYVNKKYSGSVHTEFNTMKCIDLFHSKELDTFSRKYSAPK
ncbi:MAG TPA: T6SS amidase immunity protein Tai4 family protein [Telluria sp.]